MLYSLRSTIITYKQTTRKIRNKHQTVKNKKQASNNTNRIKKRRKIVLHFETIAWI
jgi:hypothetical protein